jgi:hypothetical protein
MDWNGSLQTFFHQDLSTTALLLTLSSKSLAMNASFRSSKMGKSAFVFLGAGNQLRMTKLCNE